MPENSPTKEKVVKPFQEPLVSPEVAAATIGLSLNTLAKMRMNREGPPYHKFGRAVRYDPRDVRAYMEKQKTVDVAA